MLPNPILLINSKLSTAILESAKTCTNFTIKEIQPTPANQAAISYPKQKSSYFIINASIIHENGYENQITVLVEKIKITQERSHTPYILVLLSQVSQSLSLTKIQLSLTSIGCFAAVIPITDVTAIWNVIDNLVMDAIDTPTFKRPNFFSILSQIPSGPSMTLSTHDCFLIQDNFRSLSALSQASISQLRDISIEKEVAISIFEFFNN